METTCLYGGVWTTRAKHSVGFIIHKEKAKYFTEKKFLSGKILYIKVTEIEKTTIIIQIYQPCNDSYSEKEKSKFFKQTFLHH